MGTVDASLTNAVDAVLETLPPVWDRIRSNLRAAATSKFGITLEQFHVLRHIRKGYQSVGELAETEAGQPLGGQPGGRGPRGQGPRHAPARRARTAAACCLELTPHASRGPRRELRGKPRLDGGARWRR